MKSIFACLLKDQTVEYVLAEDKTTAEKISTGKVLQSYSVKYFMQHEKDIQKFYKRSYSKVSKNLRDRMGSWNDGDERDSNV